MKTYLSRRGRSGVRVNRVRIGFVVGKGVIEARFDDPVGGRGGAGSDAENAEAYADADQRYWQVSVAPGRYVGNVSVPWRPYVGIHLDSAVIAGDVARVIPAWTGNASNRTSTLVIRGNSMRGAYLDGIHSVVGVEGAVRFQGAAATPAAGLRGAGLVRCSGRWCRTTFTTC